MLTLSDNRSQFRSASQELPFLPSDLTLLSFTGAGVAGVAGVAGMVAVDV